MKKVNVNKIFALDLCRCKYFDQVHLITLTIQYNTIQYKIIFSHLNITDIIQHITSTSVYIMSRGPTKAYPEES